MCSDGRNYPSFLAVIRKVIVSKSELLGAGRFGCEVFTLRSYKSGVTFKVTYYLYFKRLLEIVLVFIPFPGVIVLNERITFLFLK